MTDTNRRAGSREWAGLAVLALPCLLYSMDLTVLYLAVPALTADLAPSASQLLWIVDVYGFMLAGSLLTMGALGDRIGRRRLLMAGAAAFGAISVLAAFAPGPAALVAFRAALGLAAGALAPSTLSLIRVLFRDDRQRRTAIGVWAASFSAGAALGPVAGGLLLELFWWGSVFLLAVPVMAVLLVLGPRLLPEHRGPDPEPLDVVGALLSVIAVLGAVYGLKALVTDASPAGAAVAVASAGAAGAAFVHRARRREPALVDLRLFRGAAGAALVASLLSLAVFAGFELFVAQYLQLGVGLSPFVAGLWTVPAAAGLVLGSLAAPVLAARLPSRTVIALGFATAAAGFAVVAAVPAPPVLLLVGATTVAAAGIAPVGTLATDLVVSGAPERRAGTASGRSETALELGGALGIAVLGSIGLAVFRAGDGGGDTVGAAVRTAATVPGPAGDAALAAVRASFADGMQVAAVVAALVCAVVAVTAPMLLARRRG